MWGMFKYIILIMYKYILWHNNNYTLEKLINNFHMFFFQKLNLASLVLYNQNYTFFLKIILFLVFKKGCEYRGIAEVEP
jgi:hypothetical protein